MSANKGGSSCRRGTSAIPGMCRSLHPGAILRGRGYGVSLLSLTVLLLLFVSSMPGAASGYTPRTGFVTLQFDDSHDLHYMYIYPALEQCGLKGSFGYITEVSDMGIRHSPQKMQEIYNAGHEVQDHTTRHDYMWATHVDTLDDGNDEWIECTLATVAQWDSLCDRSMYILDALGISVTGWNQPGGSMWRGQIPGHPEWAWLGLYNDSLYDLIGSRFYYALAAGVFPNTAHLNLRGHNFPQRFPFFNVPHVTIDGMSLNDIKADIADGVASGLWYIALSHSEDMQNIAKVMAVIDWVHQEDIEVLKCCEGVDRVLYGIPDPLANQLPQAAMLRDRDGNNKPDGFAGCCTWDTVYTAPVEGVHCMRITGPAEFYCYGPEPGTCAFSVWMKMLQGMPSCIWITWVKAGFDWEYLGDGQAVVPTSWVWKHYKASTYQELLIDVDDEVDRIRFVIEPGTGMELLVAYPELLLAPVSGAAEGDEQVAGMSRLRVVPNPVRSGGAFTVFGARSVTLYDVLGRSLPGLSPYTIDAREGEPGVEFSAEGLVPGVYFLYDAAGGEAPAKVIIQR